MALTTSKSINQGGLCMKKLTAALMCGAMTMSLFATAQAGETGSEQKDAAQEAIDARKEEAEKTGEQPSDTGAGKKYSECTLL